MYDKEKLIKEALEYLHEKKVDNETQYYIRNLIHIIAHPDKYN